MEQVEHERSDLERARLTAQYEAMMDLFARRHGMTMQEMVEIVRRARLHDEWWQSMRKGGALALIGFLASALTLATWEGIKSALRR